MDDTPSADDAPNDDRNHPRRRRPHDLDLDERSLERRLGAPILRLLRQRRIAGACLCVVKVPMDPRASREDIDGGIREYSQVYGVASLDVPGGTGAEVTEMNASSKAPGKDDENVKKRIANNYGEEVDPRVTLFDVGSCAKIFPAIAIARESGIDLDDDADDHLPQELAVASMATNASTKLPNPNANPNDAKPVTVGDLLRHTGEIVDVTGGLTGEAYTRVQRQLLEESATESVSLIAPTTPNDTPATKRARLARITRSVGKALEAGAKRVECDHNLDLAVSIVEHTSGIEYERYVIDELRVGVKDAVSRTKPSALRNTYSALSGDALDDDWNRGGVRAGRYVVELTNDAGNLQNGGRALVRRKASRREDPDGSSAAIEPNGNVWMTPWEMSRCVRGLLAPGAFVDTARGIDDLVGDAVFSWHGVDGAFAAKFRRKP